MHEYTHGLSNRLVVDAQGNSTLNSIQAGAMGEAWSDYYAMDYLVTKGLVPDSSAAGEVFEGEYVMAGLQPFRTEAIDCPVGSTAAGCTQHRSADQVDTPTATSRPSVERPRCTRPVRCGRRPSGPCASESATTRPTRVITRGMELAPADPTLLDMRNAIVQANLAVYAGSKTNQIWHTFATRGMGWYAGTIDAGDAFPQENFKVPPSPQSPRGTITGVVKDAKTGDPIRGALVAITGHSSGFTGDYSAVTNPDGTYTIPDVYVGTYALARVTSPGYEVIAGPLTVVAGSNVENFAPRRDWAAASGGGVVTAFNGPDFSPQCGPIGSIDLSQGTGWGSTTGDDAGTPTDKMIPKYVTIKLPSTTKVTSFAVNPSNTCGDPGSSSTGKYKIQTSPDGSTWSTALKGTFDATMRHLNQLTIDKPISGVNYVKFWMLSPQVPDFHHTCPLGNYGGCTFTDMTEIEVFGDS